MIICPIIGCWNCLGRFKIKFLSEDFVLIGSVLVLNWCQCLTLVCFGLVWFFCGFIRFDLLVGFSGQVLRSEFYWMDIASDWVLLDGSRILAVRFQWNIDGCVRLHFTVSIVFWTMCLMFARLFCFNSLLPPPLSVFLSLVCWS